ncbi:thiamine phosphate synthase [Paenibacillus methanolicus]|uniref:Thiamine-phosphate synthase n=1 Tax=Paenibacillus methanolicus TaxID=582686 RepID=A0A5S5BUE4_9BACL|nr:thiamine-phosphate pyrophosphorylase [Paenibacillus methanolicus]
MKSKTFDFSLYVITGENYHPGRKLEQVMEQALRGGADIVQLRAKDAPKREVLAQARMLRDLTARYQVPLIINDHLDIAQAVSADGVHLGQEDLPLAEARAILGPDRIIGISTHNIAQALEAQAGGADYIGVGPVFPTGTKPGRQAVTTSYVREAAERVTIPFVAIGGITLDNVDAVLEAGAKRVCAVSAIVGSAEPAETCRAFKHRLRAFAAMAMPDPASKRIRVNGREDWTNAGNVQELVRQYGLQGARIVVELDGVILSREAWADTQLAEGAQLELVHFVGGG